MPDAKNDDVNAPLFKMWSLLRPRWKDIWQDKEIVGMFAICLARAWELRINTRVVRSLDSTLANRNIPVRCHPPSQ